MAVQKKSKSRSRRDMRRAQNSKFIDSTRSEDPVTGEVHRRHHLTASGYYRGRPICVAEAADVEDSGAE